MKITIYELLGLIKDGKDLPEKISYIDTDGFKYVFDLENDKNYWCEELGSWLFNNWDIQLILNDEVEILPDEEDEFIDIEELKIDDIPSNRNERYLITNNDGLVNLSVADYELATKIDKLIENQKKIITALKENK